MDYTSLLQTALEMLLEQEYEEAAHAFRSFSEDLEQGGIPDTDEILLMLKALVDVYEA